MPGNSLPAWLFPQLRVLGMSRHAAEGAKKPSLWAQVSYRSSELSGEVRGREPQRATGSTERERQGPRFQKGDTLKF